MRLSFAEFVIDFGERRIFSNDHEVRLTPKAFDLLRLLIEHRPNAVAKQEIFARLWPDTFVSENNLAALVADMRSALGDQANEPRFIRTVYAYGYAFVGLAGEPQPIGSAGRSAEMRWTLVLEQREIPLQIGENILGRTGAGVIALDSSTVSRHHARLTITDTHAVIEDLGSKNGTWVGSVAVTGPTSVRNGDVIRLGSLVVTVCASANPASTETVERADLRPRSAT
jgi:DNA-binding winged helix-turn-helix (wHTH) protein